MPKPSTLPKFAEQDIIDPTSGQLNVEEPDDLHKDYGWSFKEKPPRQFFNWLHRCTYTWLKWIDDTTLEGKVIMKLTCNAGTFTSLGGGSAGSLVGGEIHFDLYWLLKNDFLCLSFPSVYGTLSINSPLSINFREAHPPSWVWANVKWAVVPVLSPFADSDILGLIPGQASWNLQKNPYTGSQIGGILGNTVTVHNLY